MVTSIVPRASVLTYIWSCLYYSQSVLAISSIYGLPYPAGDCSMWVNGISLALRSWWLLATRLLNSPSGVSVGLRTVTGMWDLKLTGSIGPDIVWDFLSCNGLWSCDRREFSLFFQRPLTIPMHGCNGRQLPAVRAVQGDCERVYLATQLSDLAGQGWQLGSLHI